MGQEFDLIYHTGCSWKDVENMLVRDRVWLHWKLQKQKEGEHNEVVGAQASDVPVG